MTTYSSTLTISDSQNIALEAALKMMIEHCEQKISEKAGAPYWAHKKSCEEILVQLRKAQPTVTSTNNFGKMEGLDE